MQHEDSLESDTCNSNSESDSNSDNDSNSNDINSDNDSDIDSVTPAKRSETGSCTTEIVTCWTGRRRRQSHGGDCRYAVALVFLQPWIYHF